MKNSENTYKLVYSNPIFSEYSPCFFNTFYLFISDNLITHTHTHTSRVIYSFFLIYSITAYLHLRKLSGFFIVNTFHLLSIGSLPVLAWNYTKCGNSKFFSGNSINI